MNCLKGVVLCRFDLSFGPVPVTIFPPDFLTVEQSKRVAMRSLLRLSASQGRTAAAISAFDDMGTMWIGILDTLPTAGFYTLVTFFDVNVPRFVSDNIDRIKSLLAEIGLKLPQNVAALGGFVKQVFTETQDLLDQLGRESAGKEQHWPKELEEGIEKVAKQIQLVINEYQRTGVHPDRHLTQDAMNVMSILTLLAVKCNRHLVAQSLVSLLTQLERMQYQGSIL
jgi:hypothetical protein